MSWSSARSPSRPGWSRPTSARRPRADPRWGGSCSTTATRSVTRSSAGRATAGGTARRSVSGWSSPPNWPGGPAGSTTTWPPGTRAILRSVGLPTTYAAEAFDELVTTMGLDKKTRGSQLRFVILNGLASAEILAGPDPDCSALRDGVRLPSPPGRECHRARAGGARHRVEDGGVNEVWGELTAQQAFRRGGPGVRRPGAGDSGERLGRTGAGGVGSAGAGRAHLPLADHRGDLSRPAGGDRGHSHARGLLRRHRLDPAGRRQRRCDRRAGSGRRPRSR